jgi:hypothetical protein
MTPRDGVLDCLLAEGALFSFEKFTRALLKLPVARLERIVQ